MKLGWVLAGLGAVFALGTAIMYGGKPMDQPSASGVEPPVRELGALEKALQDLDQRLARIESLLAQTDSRGTREPALSSAVPSAATSDGPDELRKELRRVSDRIDLLAASLKENHKPAFSIPTLEQVHAARQEVDWAYVDQLRQVARTDQNAARKRVLSMGFDDLLSKIGMPNKISEEDGRWFYFHDRPSETGEMQQQGLIFHFVGDRVSDVFPVN